MTKKTYLTICWCSLKCLGDCSHKRAVSKPDCQFAEHRSHSFNKEVSEPLYCSFDAQQVTGPKQTNQHQC